MKVLFVLPPFDLSAALGSSTKMKRGFLPSLGVGYIAGMLDSRGHETALLDAQVMDLDPLQTVEGILKEDPAIIGMFIMGVYAHAAYTVVTELKARAPHIIIVAGVRRGVIVCNDQRDLIGARRRELMADTWSGIQHLIAVAEVPVEPDDVWRTAERILVE